MFDITILVFTIRFIDHRQLDVDCFLNHTILGIILKMARLTKDTSHGQKSGAEFVKKAPLKSLIIHAKDLVQVIAQVCYFSNISNLMRFY